MFLPTGREREGEYPELQPLSCGLVGAEGHILNQEIINGFLQDGPDTSHKAGSVHRPDRDNVILIDHIVISLGTGILLRVSNVISAENIMNGWI